jgi:tetratricopeptide (TPR) repeat protein
MPPPVPDRRKRPTTIGAVPPPTPTPPISADVIDRPTVLERAMAAAEANTPAARAKQLTAAIEAAAATDPRGAANLAYELGELYERQLADEDRAVLAYRRASDLDGTFAPPGWGLRRVLYRRQRWAELLVAIDKELPRAREDNERTELLVEKARVLALRGRGDAEARVALSAALAATPGHQGALLELERVLARLGDTKALLDAYLQLAEAAEQPERKIAYYAEAAQLATEADVDRVLAALDDAARVAAVAQLAPWAGERVARERLRLVDTFGLTVQLGGAMDALGAALNTSAASDPTRRRELVALRRRQALHVRTEMPINAWDYLQQARELAPNEPVVLVELIELANELGRYRELAQLVRDLEGDASSTAMVTFWVAEAHLRPERRASIRALLKSLETRTPGALLLVSSAECEALADPSHEAARGDLANAYLAGAGAVAGTEPNAAAALYVQAAELFAYYTRSAQRIGQARSALVKALELAPENPAVLEAWIELADNAGDADEALAKLRAQAIASRGDRGVLERALRVARKHGRMDAVLELERDLVTLVPDDIALAWRLESALAEVGRDEERADLLVKIAARDPEPARRKTALLWAARLHARAGTTETAIDLYRQLLALAPDDVLVRDALVGVLREKARWRELASERRAEARAVEPAAARRAWREAAWVLEVLCDDLAQAAEVYGEWWRKLPDDRTALEGVARTRAALRDHAGEVAARAAIAAIDQTTDAHWLHARSLERAGQHAEAADVYRRVLIAEDSQVAATSATLGLAAIATRTGNVAMRVEAAEALAKRTTDARLAGALLAENAWTLAFALDDDARASDAFELALLQQPTHGGTLLGGALVAVRRDDPGRLGKAFSDLADAAKDPALVAAVALRAAAAALADNNPALAAERIAAAREARPDDAYALVVATETAQVAPSDDDDPFAMGEPQLARGELFAKRAALSEDATAQAAWELDRADVLEGAGLLREAGAAVAEVLRRNPDDRRALSSLRRIARRGGDSLRWAQASYALARRSTDPANVLQLLRDAVDVYDRPGRTYQADYARVIYRRIVALAPGAGEFERLLVLMRERGDVNELVDVLTERLRWLADSESPPSEEMVPLLFERASLLHGLGRNNNAAVDLDSLLDYAPNHAEALRLRADLAVDAGDIDRAVALWWRYLAVETVGARRAEIEVRLEKALGSDEGVAPPPGATSSQRMAAKDPDNTDVRPPRTPTRKGFVAQRAETATHTVTTEADLITSAPRTSTRRGPAIIRRASQQTPVVTPVMPIADDLDENTARVDLSELQEAERREAQMFESNTALTDLSELQEAERREATKSSSISAQLRTTFDEPTVEGPPKSAKRGPAIIRRPATTGSLPIVRPTDTSDQHDLGMRKTELAAVPVQAAKQVVGGTDNTVSAVSEAADAWFDLGADGGLEAPSETAESPADVAAPRRAAQIEIPSIDMSTSSVIAAGAAGVLGAVVPAAKRALTVPPLDLEVTRERRAEDVEPSLEAGALTITEERAAVPDDSAVVVMLSYSELQHSLSDDTLGAALELCARELAAADEPAVRAALAVEAGRLSDLLGNEAEARKHYDAALAADPQSRTALASLRRIARGEGDLVEVTRLLDAELAFATGTERDALARYRLDLLLARGEYAAVVPSVEVLVARNPDDIGALLVRLELALRGDRTEDVDAALELLAAALSEPELRAGVHTARCVRAERAGTQPPAAPPASAGAPAPLPLAAIRQAVADDQREAAGLALLELAYHVEGEDPMTAAALAVRAQGWIHEAAATAAGQAAIAEAAQLAARIAARDPLVARIATESALVAKDTTIAIHAFARWGRCKSPTVERAYAAARAAELEPAKFGRMWAQVQELDPGDDYAIAKLRAAHLAAGEVDAAIELDVRRAKETGREAPVLDAVAELLAVSHVDEALAILLEARAARPTSVPIAEALADVYARCERWIDRAKLLGELAAAPGAPAPEIIRRRTAQAWDRAARAGAASRDVVEHVAMAALDAWDQVREADPTSPLAHASAIALASTIGDRDLLVEALSRAQAIERSPWAAASLALRRARLLLDTDPRLALEVARDAAKGLDDPRRTLVVMLAAAHRRELVEAAAALEERATHLETAARPAGATTEPSMLRVRAAQLALDASDAARATRLLSRVDATWPGVAELADVARRRVGAPPAKTTSFLRVLRDADAAAARNEPVALQLYQRALELQPGDSLAATPLIHLASQLRQPMAITKLSLDQVRAAQSASPATKVDAQELVARVELLRGDAARAHAAYEVAAQHDPSRFDLVHRLARPLAAAGRYRELCGVRERELAIINTWLRVAADAERRVDGAGDLAPLLVDAAVLALHDKRPEPELVKLYAAVVDAEPGHRRGFLQLEALARRAGSPMLAELQRRLVMLADDPRVEAALLVRVGETLAAAGKASEAVAELARAVETDPDYAPAFEAWMHHAIAGHEWHEVARAATRKAELATDRNVAAAQHHLAGVVLMDQAGANEQAIAAFRRVHDVDPAHRDTFARLRSLFERSGQHDELATLLRKRLEVERDPRSQVELHRSLAEHAANLGDRKRGLQHYRQLLTIDPADVRAHAAIADFLTEPTTWQEAAAAINARIPIERDPKILRSLHYRLGMLLADYDVAQALAAFQKAASYKPDDEEVLRRITDLASRAGDWKLALEACEHLVTTERDPDKLAANLLVAAQIFARGFNDLERTERMLTLALESAPTDVECLRMLVQFYRDAGNAPGLRLQMSRLVGVMRARIAADPTDGIAYRTLSRASVARGEAGSLAVARAAAEIAHVLGAAGEPEHRLLAAAPELSTALDEQLFAGLIQPELRHVLHAFGDAIAKHVGIDLNAYGVTRKHRLRPSEPVVMVAREVATALGYPDVEVYVSTRRQLAMVAEPTNPVSLVLGSSIASGDPREVRFAAGAALTLVRTSLAIPARLPPEELGILLLAIMRLFQPTAVLPGVRVEEAEAQAAKLRRSIAPGLVSELQALAERIDTLDHLALAQALTIAGLRAGWAASGNLLPGLMIIAAAVGSTVPGVLGHPIARGLVSYALAELTPER